MDTSPSVDGHRGRHLRVCGSGAAGLAAVLMIGCQAYEPRPLDVAGHYSAFLERTPQSPEVMAFAGSLKAHPDEVGTRETFGDFDPSDGLTCSEAEIIALVYNPELRLARMRAGLTRAAADHAGLWDDPVIGLDITRAIQSVPEPWKIFTTVGITIPVSGRLETEKQRAGAEHAAEIARVAQKEWSVRMSIRRAWNNWLSLEAQQAATREFLSRVDELLTVVNMMEQAGEMARTEARLFRIERANRSSEFAVLESRAREADLNLRQLMGMSPDAPLRFQPMGFVLSDLDDLSHIDPEAVERQSPTMLVAAAEHEAAERALELEVRRQYPDLQIGPGYGREDGQDQVLFGLSIPVPILNANRQAIAKARAQRDVARASAEATQEQTISAMRAAEVRLGAAVRRRLSLESEIVPLVDEQYADARAVARLGEVSTLVLLESLSRQQEAKVDLVEAARDEAMATIDLEELIGPPAPVLSVSTQSSDQSNSHPSPLSPTKTTSGFDR